MPAFISRSTNTLRVSAPFGATLARAAALVLLFALVAEGFFRLPVIHQFQKYPVVTGYNDEGIKYAHLISLAEKPGSVDCVFVGSSIVLVGIDPAAVSAAYYRETGKVLRCTNFGLAGLNDNGVAVMADILVKQLHPRLIVYGTSYHDFRDGGRQSLDFPWAAYAGGQFSPRGWLETHSFALQALLRFRLDSHDQAQVADLEANMTPQGYFAEFKSISTAAPPDAAQLQVLITQWDEFSPDVSDRRPAYRHLLLNAAGATKLVIVEMPVPPTVIALLPGGEAAYEEFLRGLASAAGEVDAPFVETYRQPVVAASDWGDYQHMNDSGAQAFSRWLGVQLAHLDAQGALAAPIAP